MMSTTTTRPSFNIPATPRHRLLRHTNHHHHHLRCSLSTVQVKMSSTQTVVEHVVLFKVKPSTKSSQVAAMNDGLNGLGSLDMVVHLSSGPILRSFSNSYKFTHMLHSRYQTKDDLANYSSHDAHLSVVRSNVLLICDDIMIVDWVAEDLQGPVQVRPGSALRVKLVKLKDGLGDREKAKVIKVFGGLKDKVPEIEQLSFGEGFTPVRAKGFSLATLGGFAGVKELNRSDAAGESEDLSKEKEEVRSFVDDLLVVDYVVPSS